MVNIRHITNSSKEKNQSTSLKSKISSFISSFINQESQALRQSIARSGDYEWEIRQSLELLGRDLRSQLDMQMENINKLYVLLTYNPLGIDPQLYLYYLERINNPMDSRMKNLLYQRLIFHQMYEKAWEVFADSYTSITDVEEFLDVTIMELQSLHNMSFGLIDLILGTQSEYLSANFKNLAIETVCFKLHLKRELIDRCISTYNILKNMESVEDVVHYKQSHLVDFDHMYLQQIYLRRMIAILSEENDDYLKKQFSNLLTESQELSRYPGWLCLLGPKFMGSSFLNTSLYEFGVAGTENIEVDKQVKLNELDIIYLIRSGASVNYDIIYNVYQSSMKVLSLEKHIQNHLFAKLINNGCDELFQTKLVEMALVLDRELLVRGLLRLLFGDLAKFLIISQKLDKVLPTNVMQSVYKSALEAKLGRTPPKLPDLVELIEISNNLTHRNTSIRAILKHIPPTEIPELISFYTTLIKDSSIKSSQVLLELMRAMVIKHDIFEPPIFNHLFDRILNRTMKPHLAKLRPEPLVKPNNDFDEMYKTATAGERAKFHNCVRALGQMFSLLNAQDISKIITMLHSHIYLEKFGYTTSTYGKDYIYNNVLGDIMKFVERGNDDNPKQAIFKMRDILGSIECSAIPVRGYIFKLMVKEDPTKAIKLIQFYQNNKTNLSNLIQYIISGILQTKHLNKNEKILSLKSFLGEMNMLGYRHKIRQSTGYELIKVLQPEPGIENKISSTTIEWISELTENHKSLQNVIKMHSIKGQ